MINILLADDEMFALDYLKNMFDWESHGYHIVGCAQNGRKALELYERFRPEIVMSDIRMPGIDGLELSKRLKEKNPEVEIVLVSAYQDFEYAKKGIEYGVSGYLLKNELYEETILMELERIRERLEEEGEKKKIYRKYFMNQLIYDQASEENLLDGRLILMLLHKRNYILNGEVREEEWNTAEQKALGEVLEQPLEDMLFYVADVQITGNNRMLLYRIENTVSKYRINTLIENKCSQIIRRLSEIPECCVNLVYSYEIVQSEISKMFRRMSNQIRYAIFWEVNSACPVLELRDSESAVWGEELKRIREAVFSKDGKPGEMVSGLLRENSRGRRLEAYRTLLPLLNSLLSEVREEEGITGADDRQKLYTPEEVSRYYEERFEELHEQICSREEQGYSRQTAEILRYIRKNYQKELNLELLGEVFQMNGVYLGQMVKKETGSTILKHLTNVRMEEAKRLLREGCTVAEAAERAGYHTSQYFSQIFTKNVGMKPQQYRQQTERK